MPAKLPQDWIRPERKQILDLQPGESGYAHITALDVTSDGSAYLFLRSKLEEATDRGTIQVSRDAEGRYHVDLRGNTARFQITKVPLLEGVFAPVESITF